MVGVRRPRFYAGMAALALVVALVGFAGTYFLPMASGAFKGPGIVHLHGVLAFGWLLLFLTQTLLVQAGRFRTHMTLGLAAAAVAPALAVTGLMVGHYATARDVAAGGGATAVSTIIGPFMTFGMFLGLVAAGLINRRRPEVHKRLMLLATLLILWPAWFRFRHFFPGVPRPDLWFGVVLADSMILLAMLRDRLALERVHPVYLWVGTALIVETATEALLFDSAGWRVVAGWVWGVLG